MTKTPSPKINAMLICDKVITEVGTNKKSLIGIFENVNAYKFPCVHHFLSIYVKLTNGRGTYKFSLELVDLEDGSVIGKGEMPKEIEIADPLITRDLVFNLAALKFKHKGSYEFRIYANDEICGQKTFLVNYIERPKKKDA